MERCGVFTRGKDRTMHLARVEAASVYQAASAALDRWAAEVWFDESAAIEVCSAGRVYRVDPERVKFWMEHGGRLANRPPQQYRLAF